MAGATMGSLFLGLIVRGIELNISLFVLSSKSSNAFTQNESIEYFDFFKLTIVYRKSEKLTPLTSISLDKCFI